MTELIAKGITSDLKIFPIEPAEYREISLLVNKPDNPAPLVELLMQEIMDYVSNLRNPDTKSDYP